VAAREFPLQPLLFHLLGSLVTIVDVKRHGSIGVELTYKDANGHLGSELLYRDSEARLEIAAEGLPWSFDNSLAEHDIRLVKVQ